MYQALYRKWRPLTFDDVISQPHITTTLMNQIRNEKTAHAYLFTGSRGTGKTTCARILAKAVNCEHTQNGNPCLECSVCKDADISALSDIIEIDAASNNGVDDIRDLRDGAVYTPERCKYKVYIIDEVHMLSASAFNALLKIMEEPPPYVKFILATTEVHKVPATILSRCQRFDFRRIRPEDIKSRLLYVAKNENITLSPEAAELIARIADGGMRDALSLLDQCIAFSENVDLETVSSAAGIAGRDYLFDLMDSIINSNAGQALSVIDSLYSMSKDMTRLCDEIIAQFRNLMLIKTIPDKPELIACMPDETERLKGFSKQLSLKDILFKLGELQNCSERLSRSLNKRIEFEMCLIKLCTAANVKGVDNSENCDKIEQSDKKQRNPVKTAAPQPEEQPVPEKQVEQEPQVNTASLDINNFKPLGLWAEVLEEIEKVSPGISGTLKNSRALVYENVILVSSDNAFFVRLFKNKENAQILRDTVKSVLGKPYKVLAKYTGETKEADNNVGDFIKKAEAGGVPVETQN